MEKILIQPSWIPPKTDLYFGQDLLKGDLCNHLCQSIGGRPVIISDMSLKDRLASPLSQHINAMVITVPSGGQSKTTQTVQHIENELFKTKCGRDTILIALGGGVITDLVGFVASTFQRGVPLILIPTTLLAMVDASIGGKTGIDTPFGKNLIGTFYFPRAIIMDLQTLQTLPEKERLNGLSEIYKIGLIMDSSIWNLSEDRELIWKAIRGKISVIEQDPRELGLRRILNFGHTIGHGLETISNYTLSHGEAVAIGCLVESHLSMTLKYLPAKQFEQIQTHYQKFPLHLPKGYDRKALLEAMAYDKKNIQKQLNFVLIDQIGHAISFQNEYCRAVSHLELDPTLTWMEKHYG